MKDMWDTDHFIVRHVGVGPVGYSSLSYRTDGILLTYNRTVGCCSLFLGYFSLAKDLVSRKMLDTPPFGEGYSLLHTSLQDTGKILPTFL